MIYKSHKTDLIIRPLIVFFQDVANSSNYNMMPHCLSSPENISHDLGWRLR